MAELRGGRMLLAAALFGLLGYAALSALMYLRQRDLVYYPQFTRVAAETTDFELRSGEVVLRGWRVNPGRSDALLYFGGNAERVEAWRGPFAQWFGDRTVYLVGYRGYGASEGQPGEQAILADALTLYDEVRRRHPDGDIAVVGRSLGSGVAAYLASQRPVERLALVTPFDGLAEVGQAHYPWLPVRLLASERYPSADYLRGYRGRLLLLRAGRDEVVPARNTDRLLAALPVPPQVVEFPQHGHNDLSEDPRYGEALAGFMR
ncbi:alpha/beta hydrolase [Pseudoxanthomonas suwonensis]|nr:alpha/beta fold hydrolase [Pseudoxanthomonas suwonensis]